MRNEELLSPFSRLFSLPGQDCFNIITIGCKTEGNPHAIVEGLKNTLINHPRLSCVFETGHGEQNVKAKWIPTKVKVEEHVIVPHIDPNIENPDQFLEDYTTKMAISPMDESKTLWEFHLLKLKTSHSGSVAVVEVKNATPLKGKPGATVRINKFIHRIISLDDAKVVKNAMNMDLAKMMEKGSKSRWGNSICYVLFPLWIRLEKEMLEYIRRAKTTMDRKKLSLEPLFWIQSPMS
ncbi:unnamed protein product [Brassica oleracea]